MKSSFLSACLMFGMVSGPVAAGEPAWQYLVSIAAPNSFAAPIAMEKALASFGARKRSMNGFAWNADAFPKLWDKKPVEAGISAQWLNPWLDDGFQPAKTLVASTEIDNIMDALKRQDEILGSEPLSLDQFPMPPTILEDGITKYITK